MKGTLQGRAGLLGSKALTSKAFSALVMVAVSTAFAERPPPGTPAAGPIRSFADVLAQTASVVEGEVMRIEYAFDDEDGPRTVVTLSEVVTHLGTSAGSTLRIQMRGGPTPHGTVMLITEMPTFVAGKRYLVFLRNTGWHLSPVVQHHAYLLEKTNGKEVAIDQDGVPLVGVSGEGLERGKVKVFEISHDIDARVRTVSIASGVSTDELKTALSKQELLMKLRASLSQRGVALRGKYFDEPFLPSDAQSWRRGKALSR